jgi:mannitol-1-phosphate 5-dehydrogenase
MYKAVMFGAGNVGRGFLGQLFSESGYEVVFVDIDEALIGALRDQRAYTVRLVDNERTDEVRVAPVSGLLSGDADAVAEVLAEANLGATAVGARALPYIAPLVARGIALRAQRGVAEPLNLIICENLQGAADLFRDMVCGHLDAAGREYMADHVGMVGTVIGRMVPELTAELRAQDPTLIIVEPYKELPVERAGFVGEIPHVVGIQPVDDFEYYEHRKLYIHNAAHAIMAYLGYLRGYEMGYDVLDDVVVRPILDGALDESLRGIVARHGVAEAGLRAHLSDLLARLANRVLADPVLRLARDPLRKLDPADRLVGAARLAEAEGVTPANLAWGIAGALRFDAAGDPMAVELQARIARDGVETVMEAVCHIGRDEALGGLVLERYALLGSEERWRP